MPSKAATANDVARQAGVSRTTVSFVLNNTPGKNISEATRQRVLAAASALGYRPHREARRLAMIRHHSVGLFICHTHSLFSDAYISRLIGGIAQVLNKQRFQLVLQPLRLDQSGYLQLAMQDRVDGIILLNTHDADEGLAEIVAAGFPLVAIGTLSDREIPQVDIDNRSAAARVTQHLIDLGHKKIAMIVHAPLVYYAAQLRLEGFRHALKVNKLALNQDWVRRGDFTEESGYRCMRELLSVPERPTAVFAGNDMIAYGALKEIKDAGLAVPADISLAGFDDDFLSRYLNPPLTTLSVPASALGARAAQLLLQRLRENRPGQAEQIRLTARLAERDSCRPPAGRTR
jgi:DNA-binding LacI/PurR family transcriptional regulator